MLFPQVHKPSTLEHTPHKDAPPNPRNILNLLLAEFATHAPTPVSVGDQLLADGIAQLIRQCMDAMR